MENVSSSLIQVWQDNLWRCAVNQFSIPLQSSWHFVCANQAAKGKISLSNHTQDVQNLWIAPIVAKNQNNQYWIPIWIPAKQHCGQLQLSKEQLPWMPLAQFFPAVENDLFALPFHYFDDWLRFDWLDEDNQLIFQHWEDIYPSIHQLFDNLSNNTWQEKIQSLGFILSSKAVVVEKAQTTFVANRLLQNYATIWDVEPQSQWDPVICYQKAQALMKKNRLSANEITALMHVLRLQEGELLAVRVPLGSITQKFIAIVVDLKAQMSRQVGSLSASIYLYNQEGLFRYEFQENSWQSCDAILQEATLLIVNEAQRFLPQQVLPFLTQAKTALFLGDELDIGSSALMSAMPENWELNYHGFFDDEVLDQLDFKAMLPSTGNAMCVALANSAYQQLDEHGFMTNNLSLLPNENMPFYQGILVEGTSRLIGNALINEEEAQFIVKWLVSGPLSQEWQKTAIITPFLLQRNFLKNCLIENNITCEVFMFNELHCQQWDNVIFSPVYTAQDQRPFIFDQGDNLLYSLARRACKIWVIGALGIFDQRMHSPSGKLAKLLVTPYTLPSLN
ncbi:MAG: DNA2/NAM7 family helicase [Proteobacteria bacterium]|nr:DNA2/NAM7 family helicase [Pseudomonadota bacterium]